jgi:hypothetical protein
MWILAFAMFDNPGGPPIGSILLGIGIVGLVVGYAWIFRIMRRNDDRDRSSFRYRRRR